VVWWAMIVVIHILETKKTKDLQFWCSVPAGVKARRPGHADRAGKLSVICLAAGKSWRIACSNRSPSSIDSPTHHRSSPFFLLRRMPRTGRTPPFRHNPPLYTDGHDAHPCGRGEEEVSAERAGVVGRGGRENRVMAGVHVRLRACRSWAQQGVAGVGNPASRSEDFARLAPFLLSGKFLALYWLAARPGRGC
jgi:hypothetical protein